MSSVVHATGESSTFKLYPSRHNLQNIDRFLITPLPDNTINYLSMNSCCII